MGCGRQTALFLLCSLQGPRPPPLAGLSSKFLQAKSSCACLQEDRNRAPFGEPAPVASRQSITVHGLLAGERTVCTCTSAKQADKSTHTAPVSKMRCKAVRLEQHQHKRMLISGRTAIPNPCRKLMSKQCWGLSKTTECTKQVQRRTPKPAAV